jgi:hypothetical protein
LVGLYFEKLEAINLLFWGLLKVLEDVEEA